ncbi:MAG: lysylphosphatidylglycerol synthase domain-containing protein [Chitinophagales bacterium]
MKKWNLLINFSKVAIFFWMAVVIWQRFQNAPITLQWQHFVQIWQQHYRWLLMVMLLMPLNWLVEMLKWKLLLEHSGSVSFRQAGASVLGGVSTGFASPARIGEFAGRALLLPQPLRIPSLYLSALGGLAQSFVTFAVALAMLPFMNVSVKNIPSTFAAPLLTTFAVGLLLLFFFFEKFTTLLRFFPAVSIPETRLPTGVERIKILSLSAFRYGIYLCQYALLFRMAGITHAPVELFAAVAVLLAMQSVSPLSPMADVVTRGGMALLLFPQGNPAAVATAPFLLWCINLLLPAIAGYFFILNWRDEPEGR